MQCFDTFRGFLHKLYAATIDGKGREGTYIFFLTTTGGGQLEAGHNQSINQSKHISIAPYVASESEAHRAQGAAAPPPATPLAPPMPINKMQDASLTLLTESIWYGTGLPVDYHEQFLWHSNSHSHVKPKFHLARRVSTRHDTFDVSSLCILAVSSLSNSTARHA